MVGVRKKKAEWEAEIAALQVQLAAKSMQIAALEQQVSELQDMQKIKNARGAGRPTIVDNARYRIIDCNAKGMAVKDIAANVGVSVRTVYNVLRDARETETETEGDGE